MHWHQGLALLKRKLPVIGDSANDLPMFESGRIEDRHGQCSAGIEEERPT